MKISVIIPNYNYGRFIEDAIKSIYNNELAFLHEIIVINDGSTDNSKEIIERLQKIYDKIVVIDKENGGQFSCLRKGFENATGDIITLLDPDDRYEPSYFKKIIEVYQEIPYVDFVYVGYNNVGGRNTTILKAKEDYHIGCSSLMTAITGKHFWSITSTMSLRKSLARQIIALPSEYDWMFRSRGDTIIENAAILIGSYRYYIAETLMIRQIHDKNFSHFQDACRISELRFREGFRRIRAFFINYYNLPLNSIVLLKREYQSLRFKNKEIFQQYIKAAKMMKIPAIQKLQFFISMYKHYYLKVRGKEDIIIPLDDI
jgi:glycosyltransferase involved in cell wall biosynthesis